MKLVITAITLFLRKNSSSGIKLSSVFIFLLEGSSSWGGGGWAGGRGAETVLGGWGTGGAGTNAAKMKSQIKQTEQTHEITIKHLLFQILTGRDHHRWRSGCHDMWSRGWHGHHVDARGMQHGWHWGQTNHRSHWGLRNDRDSREQGPHWGRHLENKDHKY